MTKKTAAMRIAPTGWRLPDDACELLADLVIAHQPELIVECGSGRSTVFLADAAGEGGNVVALEHAEQYRDETRQMLRANGLLSRADVRLAPLEPHRQDDLLADAWYARAAWGDLHDIGMLVVDGPPGFTSRFARGPALPLLRDRLLPGCVVALDDVNRDAEQTIWGDWGIAGTTVVHGKASLVYGIFDG